MPPIACDGVKKPGRSARKLRVPDHHRIGRGGGDRHHERDDRSVAEAASSTGEIAQNIGGVAEGARMTSEGVAQTQQATAELARMSTELSGLVSTFRI